MGRKSLIFWTVLVAVFLGVSSVQAQEYKLSVVSGTKNSSGDNTVIAAPSAGQCIVLKKVQIQNESTTSTTVLLKTGSTTVYRTLLTSQGSGVVVDFDRVEKFQLAPATALVMNLSGANSHNYTIWYTVERMK